jgi:tetratricopeptide (TPR) repeat protein
MVETYRRCLDLKQARKWMILGDSYQLMGINGKASSYLKRSLFFGPSEDLVEEVEKTLEKAEKRVSKAKDEIDRMMYKVEKDPGHVKNMSKALSHLIDLDRFDEAIERADLAIFAGNDDPDIRYRKGCALFGKGEFDEALKIFEDLLDANPNSNNYKRAVNLCNELNK